MTQKYLVEANIGEIIYWMNEMASLKYGKGGVAILEIWKLTKKRYSESVINDALTRERLTKFMSKKGKSQNKRQLNYSS